MFLAAIVALVLFFTVDPFERGFFCNDESLMHPFMDDTIGNLMVALLFGIFTIILVSNFIVNHKIKKITNRSRFFVSKQRDRSVKWMYGRDHH